MKSKFKILLRAGVFSLAAVFAFAFTQPMSSQGYATTDGGQTWIDLSDPSVNYECDFAPNENCVYAEEDITSDVLEHGMFRLIP